VSAALAAAFLASAAGALVMPIPPIAKTTQIPRNRTGTSFVGLRG
jgi:hypothetical protein